MLSRLIDFLLPPQIINLVAETSFRGFLVKVFEDRDVSLPFQVDDIYIWEVWGKDDEFFTDLLICNGRSYSKSEAIDAAYSKIESGDY